MIKSGRIRSVFINLDTRFQLILVGIIVGLFSGLAAVGLNLGLKTFSEYIHRFQHQFYAVFFPVAGIVLTVLILKYVMRDSVGHGVPEVITSISIKAGRLKLRSAFSKLLGSLITISSGGSAGPEAPVIISGAAIGSNISYYLKTNELLRIAVTGSGAAAAIASIFNAPIAGIIFTMEVILGEWSLTMMFPVAIASVTGTIVSRFFNGNQIPFQHRVFQVGFYDILASLGLAILVSLLALLFIRSLRAVSRTLDTWFKGEVFKAGAGGLVVGVAVFLLPQVGGEGYDVVRTLIGEKFSMDLLPVFLLILVKILVTSFTLGAGGSGGVFAPSLVIGSLGGWFYFRMLAIVFPISFFSSSSLFALVGMAGMISGTLHAPLSGIFLIVEITGGYDAILPLMLVSFLATILVKFVEKHSIYHHELIKKGFLLRPRTDGRILSEIQAEELLEKDLITVYPDMVLSDLIPLIEKSPRNYFPVADRQSSQYLGMVFFNDIKTILFNPDLAGSIIVEEVMQTDLETVSLRDSVVEILNKFQDTNAWSLPVVESNRFVGLISKASLLDHYRRELKAQTDM